MADVDRVGFDAGLPYRDWVGPRCRCGHSRRHVMVSAVGDYTWFGWFLLLLGVSATPIAVRYQCRVCGQNLERISDPAIVPKIRLT